MSIRTVTQEDPIGLAGGLNLYGFAGGDPINFSDPFGLSADTLHVVDEHGDYDPEFERELDELASEHADIAENLAALRESESNYLLVHTPGLPFGVAWGGDSPVGLAHEQHVVDYEAGLLGFGAGRFQGIAKVGTIGGSRALIAGHEIIHLRGIEDRGLRYGHFDSQFDLDYLRLKSVYDYRKRR